MEKNKCFDFLKLCDRIKDKKRTSLILARSKKYKINDARILRPYAKCGFFSLSDLKKINDIKRRKILSSIDEFVVNNSCATKIKLPKKLTTTLCKILGALCADGYLHENKLRNKNNYWIELDDKDKIAIEKFSEWFYQEFAYKAKIHRHPKFHMWSIDATNKIIGRFLHRLTRFPLGKKSEFIDMPSLIKKYSKKYQKAFWVGFLTFDGSVNLSGTIEVLLRSKYMIRSISTFLKSEGLSITTHKIPDKNGFWRIHISNPPKNQLKKWLTLFEPGTRAWKRIYYSIYKFDGKAKNERGAIKSLYRLYPMTNSSKLSITDVFYKVKKVKVTNNQKLAKSLKIDLDTLRKYRNLLHETHMIKTMKCRKKGYHEIIIKYNPHIRTWRIPKDD